jgi:hypothetical protein
MTKTIKIILFAAVLLIAAALVRRQAGLEIVANLNGCSAENHLNFDGRQSTESAAERKAALPKVLECTENRNGFLAKMIFDKQKMYKDIYPGE